MSKRTLTLIIFLTIITGFLLYTAIRGTQTQQKNPQTAITPTSPVAATLSLSLSDPTATVSPTFTNTKSLYLLVDPHGLLVTGVQFAISYDPQIITNVIVNPGTLFAKNVILLNEVKDGKIFYAVGLPPHSRPITQMGVAATISYSLLPSKQTQTAFTFLPKTLVTAQGVNQSVLKSTSNLTVVLISPTPTSTMHTTIPGASSSPLMKNQTGY